MIGPIHYTSLHESLLFLKSGIDKSTEWSTIQACPSLMCFLNRGNTEGTNSSKILFGVCEFFVFMWVCVRTDFMVWGYFLV